MARRGKYLLICILFLVLPVLADTVLVLQNGEEIHAAAVSYNSRTLSFTLPDGHVFSRDQVRELRITTPGQLGASQWQYDPERYAALFAKGKELAEKYPNRPGVVLEDIGKFWLDADGTQGYTYRFVGLVLKQKAKSWGTVTLGMDPNRDAVEISYGVTIHPDGTFKRSGAGDLSRYDPYQGTVYFNRYQVFRLNIPDVQVGDLVEYQYTSKMVRPINKEFFFPGYYFQSTSPIALSRVDIVVPQEKKLYYEIKNFPAGAGEPQVQAGEDGTTCYRWELTDVAPFETEPDMPNESELVPRVRARVMETWDPIFDHLNEFYRTRIVVTDTVRRKVDELTGGATDVHEKIARIYHFVQREIRYISVKTDFSTGFTGHTAEVTLANGFGDCTDKAIMMATLLKAIGVEAHPIVLGTFGHQRDLYAVPNLSGNHAITKVFLDGREFFLDATASTYRYPLFRWDDHGAPYFDALGRRTGFIDMPTPETNLDQETWTLTMNSAGGAEVSMADTSTGFFEAMARAYLEETDTRSREMELRERVLGYGSGAELLGFADENVQDLLQPLKMTMDFRLPVLAKKTGGLWVLELPGLPSRYSRIDNETRRTDSLFPTQYSVRHEYTVKLPPHWELVDLPQKKVIETPLIRFRGEYERIEGGFRLIYEQVHRDTVVTPEQYGAYRQAVVEIETFFARRAFAREVEQ